PARSTTAESAMRDIRVAGAAGHERDAGLAGNAGPRVGHMDARGFVARVDELEAGVERGVENGHDVVAREREDALHAHAAKRGGERVGAARPAQRVMTTSTLQGACSMSDFDTEP